MAVLPVFELNAVEVPVSVQDAMQLLEETALGRQLIQKSFQVWGWSRPQMLASAFRWGPASKTDTTLTRHFDPKTGQEVRERSLTIFLKHDQSLFELALDMAHELVHATAKPSYDPYDPTLSMGRYMSSAIDGVGGEVDAVYRECQIGQELARKHKWVLKRCQRYLFGSVGGVASSSLGREKIKKEFYRVGKWKPYLHKILGTESTMFSELSSEQPVLFSSTGQAPYPVALLREYEDITKAACQNSLKRQETIITSAASPVQSRKSALDHFIQKRCQHL